MSSARRNGFGRRVYRRFRVVSAMLCGVCLLVGAAYAEPVDLELVLAADTSISVDAREYRLQMAGIANAFRQPDIIETIEAMPDGLAVTLVHWSVGHLNRQATPWFHLTDAAGALRFADVVETAVRLSDGRSTAIGDAIDFSVRLMNDNGFEGRARKIDVSGDARSNSGPHPVFARDRAAGQGITINGLSITGSDSRLHQYFVTQVIGGPSAFALTVDGFDDFEAAMHMNLARELTFSSLR